MSAPVPIHLLRGSDSVAVSSRTSALVTELVGDAPRDEVLNEFSGDDYPLGDAVMAANSISMFGERIVVVRNAARFAAADQKLLIDYLASPNPTSTMVVVWERGTQAGASAQPLSKKLSDAVKAAGGVVVDCDPPGQAAARRSWLAERFSSASVVLDRGAQELVADRLGDDVGRVDALLELLASTHPDQGPLDSAAVEPYLGDAGSAPPWELTDAIDRGDVPLALDRLARMLGAGQRHPLQVMSTLTSHFERMLRLDGAAVRDEREAASLLGMKGSTFPAKKALASSRRLGSNRIARAVRLLADADLQLKGAISWPPELVVEVLVARLARLSAAGSSRRR